MKYESPVFADFFHTSYLFHAFVHRLRNLLNFYNSSVLPPLPTGEGVGEREIYKIHLPQPILIGGKENSRSLLRRCV